MARSQFPRWGFRWDMAGAPATAARIDDVYAFEAWAPFEWPDWEQARDSQSLRIPAISSAAPTGSLLIEGSEQLTLLAADNTESLVNDGTTVLEIATTDPAYQTFIQAAAVELYTLLGYRDLAAEARAHLGNMKRMPYPQVNMRHAYI